jgi:hypothetical protein
MAESALSDWKGWQFVYGEWASANGHSPSPILLCYTTPSTAVLLLVHMNHAEVAKTNMLPALLPYLGVGKQDALVPRLS